jgi:hypothetical protein
MSSPSKSDYFDSRKPVIIIEGDKVEILPSEQVSPRVGGHRKSLATPTDNENSPNGLSSGFKKKKRALPVAPKPFREEGLKHSGNSFQISLRHTIVD